MKNGSRRRPLLERVEWLFPLGGRWLVAFLVPVSCVAGLSIALWIVIRVLMALFPNFLWD